MKNKSDHPIILIADRQPIILSVLTDILPTQIPLPVIKSTTDLENLIQLINGFHPTIVITDVWFDYTQSVTNLFEEFKKIYPVLKLIIFTDNPKPQLIRQAYAAGVEGFILKTEELDMIRTGIKQIYAGKTYYSSNLIHSAFHSNAETSIALLTQKERAVLSYYAKGLLPKEFADQLNIRASTAESHIRNIKQCLGFQNSFELLRWAWEQGL